MEYHVAVQQTMCQLVIHIRLFAARIRIWRNLLIFDQFGNVENFVATKWQTERADEVAAGCWMNSYDFDRR